MIVILREAKDLGPTTKFVILSEAKDLLFAANCLECSSNIRSRLSSYKFRNYKKIKRD